MVRFNCVGIPDVLEFESRKTLTELQIDDFIKLGNGVFDCVICSQIYPLTLMINLGDPLVTVLTYSSPISLQLCWYN